MTEPVPSEICRALLLGTFCEGIRIDFASMQYLNFESGGLTFVSLLYSQHLLPPQSYF
jgi:hypothetical protein